MDPATSSAVAAWIAAGIALFALVVSGLALSYTRRATTASEESAEHAGDSAQTAQDALNLGYADYDKRNRPTFKPHYMAEHNTGELALMLDREEDGPEVLEVSVHVTAEVERDVSTGPSVPYVGGQPNPYMVTELPVMDAPTFDRTVTMRRNQKDEVLGRFPTTAQPISKITATVDIVARDAHAPGGRTAEWTERQEAVHRRTFIY